MNFRRILQSIFKVEKTMESLEYDKNVIAAGTSPRRKLKVRAVYVTKNLKGFLKVLLYLHWKTEITIIFIVKFCL